MFLDEQALALVEGRGEEGDYWEGICSHGSVCCCRSTPARAVEEVHRTVVGDLVGKELAPSHNCTTILVFHKSPCVNLI